MKRLYRNVRKLLGAGAAQADQRAALSHENLKERFTYVYEWGGWGSKESLSGPGSERESGSVKQALIALADAAKTHNIKSIADIPCGDFNWMPLFLDKHPDVAYAGYDIVDEIIAGNRARHPKRSFTQLDITRDVPARADLVFSKDMLNHLTDRDCWAALANMVRSNSTYIMATSNAGFENEDLPLDFGGMSRLLNLRAAPFSLPQPIYEDGYLAMWRTSDLAFVLNRD